MSSMENLISEFFAQDNGSSNLEKQAQVELFAKLAAQNGIDLENLSEGQIAHLWNETFKTASEDEDEKKKEEDEKKKEAEAEFAEKRAAAAKLAEAEYLGRYMAHSLTDEMRKIAKGGSTLKNLGGKIREAVTGAESGRAASEARSFLANPKSKKWLADAGKKGPRDMDELRDAAHSAIRKHNIGTAARIGSGVALGVGAGAGAHHMATKKKESSALDELAANLGVEKAAAAGFDPSEAAERLGAVLVLGAGESEKIASASDLDSAVEIRSLELLEAAGYPVNWA